MSVQFVLGKFKISIFYKIIGVLINKYNEFTIQSNLKSLYFLLIIIMCFAEVGINVIVSKT